MTPISVITKKSVFSSAHRLLSLVPADWVGVDKDQLILNCFQTNYHPLLAFLSKFGSDLTRRTRKCFGAAFPQATHHAPTRLSVSRLRNFEGELRKVDCVPRDLGRPSIDSKCGEGLSQRLRFSEKSRKDFFAQQPKAATVG